jgi:GntR family transcriptional regulator
MNFIAAIRNRYENEAGPLAKRLQHAFATAIESGEIPPGKSLPAERQLAILLDVSRSTLRDCLIELERRHLVTRRHGVGTEVVGQVRKALSRLSGFSEDMRAKGLVPGTRVLARQIMPASSAIAIRTGLPLGTPVMQLTRLRFAGDETFSLEYVNVPLHAVGEDYEGEASLYERLDQKNLRPKRILQSMRATEATDEQARALGIRTGAALLEIKQVGYAADGTAVEDAIGWYRGDKFQYVGEIAG